MRESTRQARAKVRKMPVLSAVLGGSRMTTATGLAPGQFEDMEESRRQALVGGVFAGLVVPFEVTPAAEMYWWNQRDDHDLMADFQGTVRLPFDNVWMEWGVPRRVMMNGKRVPLGAEAEAYIQRQVGNGTIPEEYANAVLASVQENAATETRMAVFLGTVGDDHFRSSVYVLSPSGDVVAEMPVYRDFYTDNGTITEMADSYGKDLGVTDKALAMFQGSVGCEVTVAMTALAMINCRNIDVVDGGRALYKRTTAQKRRGAPDVRFKTIVLPGTRSAHGGSQTGSDDEDMALHRVRGHFKTFTAERPLMGKHVGTYWWGWQVRGKADNGVTVSDYQVTP